MPHVRAHGTQRISETHLSVGRKVLRYFREFEAVAINCPHSVVSEVDTHFCGILLLQTEIFRVQEEWRSPGNQEKQYPKGLCVQSHLLGKEQIKFISTSYSQPVDSDTTNFNARIKYHYFNCLYTAALYRAI